MEEKFLTVADVAERLKLNQQTVRNWIDAGTLPAVRIGRRVRIKREDFDGLVDAQYTGRRKQEPPPPAIWDGEIPDPVLPEDPAAAARSGQADA